MLIVNTNVSSTVNIPLSDHHPLHTHGDFTPLFLHLFMTYFYQPTIVHAII
jgi:hypothetical protein